MPVGIRSRLPTQATPIIGRAHELARVNGLLGCGDTRLLTLTGPAGVGKTRLALAAAAQLADQFRDGAIFVDLTPVHDPTLALSRVADALGMQDIGTRNPLGHLLEVLRDLQLLLVLDNFEQVLPAAVSIAELLAGCMDLRVLVTSRIPLQLHWEQVLRIGPLPVPNLTMALPPLDSLMAIPSIALFLQRVRAHQADFALSERQVRLVAHLVMHLDGLPLAIELAAARTATLSLPTVASRLGEHLHLLRQNAPDVPERQQSLEAAVNWSYDLLDEPEQRLFRCLGVFVGRVDLEAITAVYSEVVGEARGGDDARMLDRMASLVDQSLIQPAWAADPGGQPGWADDEVDDEAEPTFGILEMVREYAEDRLASAGELETACRAHAAYFLQFAERADSHLHDHAQRMWLLQLEREHDNLRAALRWLLDQETPADRAAALRLAGALGYFWQLRGYHAEGRRWLDEAFSRAPHGEEMCPEALTRAHLAAGIFRACFGELDRARGHLEATLAVVRQRQDFTSIVQSLIYLGVCALFAGQAVAVPLLEEALSHAQVLGDADYVGIALFYLGAAFQAQGDTGPATEHFVEALNQLEAAGDVRVAGAVHIHLAAVLSQQGDRSGALWHLRAGLSTSISLRSRWLLSQSAWAVLVLLGDRTDPDTHTRLLGAIGALRQAMGAGNAAWERMSVALGEPEPRGRLAQEEWAAYQSGSALPAGEVAALVLRMLDEFALALSPSALAARAEMSRHPERAQAARQDDESRSAHLLTKRERAVLRLVEQGLSNKAIGQQLFISARTVSQHLTSVFNKLGVNTRAQAVAKVARYGLA
ncbi:MAG: LuxR C-terminal-related transcriptional regulator [Nitrososphaerota archaeon]